ncbi:MAG: histidine ammonia-lyase [Bacteroidota bacterium]
MAIPPLDGKSLTICHVYEVACLNEPVKVAAAARGLMKLSRKLVEKWVRSGETIYGVTTGFGEFSTVAIPFSALEALQRNLILSHSAGTGDPLPPAVIRAMMLLRANVLVKGFSGVRPELVDYLVRMVNADILPVIPRQGSVGSSGDLVPLSHLGLAMIGKGRVWVRNGRRGYKEASARVGLKKVGLPPLRLTAKEGVALINGTEMMTAYTALAVYQSKKLCKVADIAAAISVEVLKGSDTAFDERIHNLRPYAGQKASARNLQRLIQNSLIRESHRYGDPRVQDAYSLRCAPQVHGASRDAVDYVKSIVSIEINAATDNPLIFADKKLHLEGGNFHGQPIALAADFLAIALAELANISERRIDQMMHSELSELPKFLTRHGGLNSGMMMLQYVAASLVSENKVLAHPASVDSIPTSAGKEDHNSMGSIAAQKLWQVLKNTRAVLAIELLVAAQGLDFHRPLKSGKGVEAAHRFVRKHVKHLGGDRVLAEDIQTAVRLVESGDLLRAVETAVGRLL